MNLPCSSSYTGRSGTWSWVGPRLQVTRHWLFLGLQKLEEQEQRAQRLKEKLRSQQQSLRRQLERLGGLSSSGERERLRTHSLDSSGLSSERSDSDQGECPRPGWRRGEGEGALLTGLPCAEELDVDVDVESLVFTGEADLLRSFSAGREHSYSHGASAWL